MPQKVFSLGALAEPESIYTDTPLTKKEIGQLMNVSRQSIVKWDKIANQVTSYLAPNEKTRTKPIREGKTITTI